MEREGWTMLPVKFVMLILIMLIVLMGCGENNSDGNAAEQAKESEAMATYVNITPEEAKKIMDSEEGYVILDVRTQEEYDEKHIPGAVLLPNTEIDAKAEDVLTDKGQQILVYCRSGRRSKQAAEALVKLGYTNVKEFGGIIDWPYEVE